MKEAMYYDQLMNLRVHCRLCPHQCFIDDGKVGKCGVRKNEEGILRTLTYEKLSSMALDPIEKKPLYHFYPGWNILSVGSFGCNFKCDFCQNHAIAQGRPPVENVPPEQLVQSALNAKNNVGIAFTYNEPTVYYEYMLETAKLAKKKGLQIVVVTNGFIMPEPLEELLPYVDAMNIDLKAFNDRFYHELCDGERAPVMEAIRIAATQTHVEVTTLLLEGQNTLEGELDGLFRWLAGIDRQVPLHLTRYFPQHKRKDPPTPIYTLEMAKSIAQKYLDYVYIGNVAGEDRTTYCPSCGAPVIDRDGNVHVSLRDGNKCSGCGYPIKITIDNG